MLAIPVGRFSVSRSYGEALHPVGDFELSDLMLILLLGSRQLKSESSDIRLFHGPEVMKEFRDRLVGISVRLLQYRFAYDS